MRINHILTFVLVLLVLSILNSRSFAQCAKYEPPNGKVLYVIGQDNNATGRANHGSGYADDPELGAIAPGGATVYYSLLMQPGEGLNTYTDWGAGPLQAQAYADNSYWDNSVICIGVYMQSGNTILNDITTGGRNAHLDALSNWVKSLAPRPVYLRLGYEFDGQYTGNPSGYIDAWKYIYDRFESQNVDNAAYVWQAASGIGTENHLSQWYPGDDYVDWMGYSHFEFWGNQVEGQGILDMARNHNKPVMIAEAMPHGYELDNDSEASSAWNNYFTELISEIEANSDVIKALCYINQDWEAQSLWNGQGWGDSRIQNTIIENNWVTELSDSKWMHASTTLFDQLENCGQNQILTTQIGSDITLVYPENSASIQSSTFGGLPPYSHNWTQLSGTPALPTTNQNSVLQLDNLELGNYTFLLSVNDSEQSMAQDTLHVSVVDLPQEPYPQGSSNHQLPGTIQAEDYDIGGQNVSFYDNTGGNEGESYRSDDVDIGSAGNGFAVAWIVEGEWIEFTADINTTGLYDITFKTATPLSGASIDLSVDGSVKIDGLALAESAGWNTYQSVAASDILLLEGQGVILRTTFHGFFNLDEVEFTLIQPTDCNGDVNGNASIDECLVCSGGLTNIDVNECLTSTKANRTNKSSVYPNPFHDQLHVHSGGWQSSWKLLDSKGRELISGTSDTIDMLSYSSGLYVLVVNGERHLISKL